MRHLSTQRHLLGLVAAVLVPLLAFAAFLLIRYEASERERFEREAVQIARQVAMIVDAELTGLLSLLRGLSASSALSRSDFATFQAEAERLVQGRDEVVLLRDLGTRQFVNTRLPFGTALPPAVAISDEDRAAFVAGRPVVGDVYASPISGDLRIPLTLPVTLAGETRLLAITVPTQRILEALVPAVPAGWIVGVGDRKGVYVTRSLRHDDVSGRPGLSEYISKAIGKSGTFTSSSFEGVPLLAGYYRSDFADWLVAANIPQRTVEAPLWRSLFALAVLGIAALGLSALLAYLFGGRFVAAAKGLADRAVALGEGRPVPSMHSPLTEFSVVGDALVAAAAAVEKRTRELHSVLATVPAAVLFTYDPEVRRVVRNRFAAGLLGIAEGDTPSIGAGDARLRHVELTRNGQKLTREQMPLYRAMRGEHIEDEEYTYEFSDGSRRTMLTNSTALRGEDGSIIGAVSVSLDITERKRGEEQRELLVHELNHRVKNTLATVQSIVLQTLRNPPKGAEATKALSDRLIALARAHDVLTRESWVGAELHDVVDGIIAVHEPQRFTVTGPPVRLSPTLTLSLALALHELATNAAKYGALSAGDGRVAITWTVEGTDQTTLCLRWRESGGPLVETPTHTGFGSRLIQRTLSAETGGSATIDYAPDGVTCTIRAPLPKLSAAGE